MQKPVSHFWLMVPMLGIPSLYPLAHAMPLQYAPGFLFAAIIALYAILHTRGLKPALNTPWPTAMLITTLTLASLFNHQPFPTFLPTAWNQLIRPLCHAGLLPLLTPLALAFTTFTMRSLQHAWPQINRFTLALFTCLLMWPDGAADLPALGLLILSFTLLLTRQRIQWPELAALILLIATAATARAIFIYLPLLMGFSLFAVWPKRGLAVALGGTALMLLLKPTLPTLPLESLTTTSNLTAIALLLIVLIQSLYHWRWWPAPRHAAWGLGAPLFVVALANLSETASFASWYGAIYLTPALPVVIYTLLRPTYKHQ